MTHDPHSSSLFSLLSPTPSFYAGEAEIYGRVGKGGGSGAGSCRTGAGERVVWARSFSCELVLMLMSVCSRARMMLPRARSFV